ncbi:MAG: nucleoside triphosphate pyrophosphatase, partial [Pseudomonadota bacterium]
MELLAQIGITPYAVRPADIDETPAPDELPRAYAKRMAREKAEASIPGPGEAVLCADTVVAVGRRILGKPEDEAEARRFLELMSGRRHRVITAVALHDVGGIRERDVTTQVRMRRLAPAELDAYLARGEWRGKAGGYAIQGAA